jgi:hypothetical protein
MTHILRGVTVEAFVLAMRRARIPAILPTTGVASAVVPIRRKQRAVAVPPAFAATARSVNRAKDALLEAVPSPRGAPGAPLAEALLRFEAALRDAAEGMDGWRTTATAEVWRACRAALEASLADAERLRVRAPTLDYEGLVTVLGDLLSHLDVFDDAARTFRDR